MKVAVIGAGLGGLAVSLALIEAGFAVDVYERAPQLVDLGAGVTLAPNATRIIQHLNVADLLQPGGGQEVTDYQHYATGELLRRVDHTASAAKYGAPHWRIHRWDLQEAMATRLAALSRTSLHLGWQLETFRQFSDRVDLQFRDGRTSTADIVVAADGIRSVAREQLFGSTPAIFTSVVAWRGLVPTQNLPADLVASVCSFGQRRHILRYPVRRSELINFVAFAERNCWEDEGWTIPASTSEFQEEFAMFDERTRALIHAPLAGTLFKWGLFGRENLLSWSLGRVVLLGDAAHPMLPFIGQGGAMALEDAIILTRALTLEHDPVEAFSRYQNARKDRAIAVTERSIEQGNMYEGEPSAASLRRDERIDLFSYDAMTVVI